MVNESSLHDLATVRQELSHNGSLVHIMNDQMVRVLMPAVIYISLMMILSLVGNVFVCYYYTFKEKRSPNTFFIVVLSVYDLLTCLITMPTDIATMTLYYTFVNDHACRILRFVNFSLAIASILTLVAIATDRYKRICHVARPQMNLPQARHVSVIIVLISILLSIPTLLIYGVYPVPIVNYLTLDVYGQTCLLSKEVVHSVYVWTYIAAQFFGFVFLLAVLVVLYSIIGRAIYCNRKRLKCQFKNNRMGRKFIKFNKTATSTTITIEEMTTNTTGMRIESLVNQLVGTDNNKQFKQHMPTQSNAEHIPEFSNIIHETNKANLNTQENEVKYKAEPKIPRRRYQLDADTVRVTILMVTVTVIFIVSFLPYLSFAVWSVIEDRHEALFLSKAGLVAYHIGFRSYLLNSALNPWIYGIFNSQFRQFFFGWCFRKCD